MNNNSDFIKITVVGDCMCLKEQLEAIRTCGRSSEEAFDSIFEYMQPLFASSDFIIGNLETPICNEYFSDESICFNTPLEYVRALKKAGFDYLVTANNHALDRGLPGLCQTLDNLDDLGIGHTGTYRNVSESERPAVVDVKGLNIGIISCTFGTNSEYNGIMLDKSETFHIDLLKKQNKPARVRLSLDGAGSRIIPDNVTPAAITNLNNQNMVGVMVDKVVRTKAAADITIVMPHVGGQYNPAPASYTKYIVKEFVNIQPSVIIAGHPHVPLRFELVKNVPVSYSLGNFSFTPGVGYYVHNVLAEYGIILNLYCSRLKKSIEKISFSIIKNIVGNDNISRPIPVHILYDSLETAIERDFLKVEVEAVVNRIMGTGMGIDIKDEYILPPHMYKVMIINGLHMYRFAS